MAQTIHIDATETLLSYPPIRALPTAATVRVQTPGTSMPAKADAVAATVSSADTTLSGAAVDGVESVAVVSATGIVADQSYVVAGNGVPSLVVRVQSVNGLTAYLKDPLPVALPSGATFKGWSVSYSTSDTSQAGEGLAKWTATVSGVVYQWDQQFRIVRDDVNYTLNNAKLMAAYPVIAQLRFAADKSLDEVIHTAWEHQLAPDLGIKDLDLNRINSWEIFEAPHAKACLWHLVNQNQDSDSDYVERLWVDYGRSLKQALSRRGIWYDEGNQDTPRADDDQKTPIRTMSITR